MKTIRAIVIGSGIWILAIIAFTLSFYLPFTENLVLQSNIVLSVTIIPLVIMGTKLYYKKYTNANPFLVGLILFATVAVLDALITVPFFMKPNGLGYSEFFISQSFWMIAIEFYTVALITGKLLAKS